MSRVDRAVVDLTLRVVDGVRSFRLAAAISAIVKKLEEAVEGRVSRLMKEVGFQVALKLSLLAQNWGNVHARDWASDASFAVLGDTAYQRFKDVDALTNCPSLVVADARAGFAKGGLT